ncbi:MAG: CotH kinase family protein [Sedimentisphaerales bacterium]|nr:CotH kinase family protein [Sedimentisphaerales bacterium]
MIIVLEDAEMYFSEKRIIAVILPSMTLLACWLAYNREKLVKTPQLSDDLFTKNHVAKIHIETREDDWKQLVNSADENMHIRASFSFDDELYQNVAIRPKGFSSLMSAGTSGRLPIKVDFNFFNTAQTFRGIKKLNLNNGFMDPSFIRDIIGYELFKEMDLPTPRAAFADVWVNETHLGLYTIVEQIDKTFLRRNFKNPNGNLYKPEPTAGALNWTKEDVEKQQANMPQTAENKATNNLDIKIGGTTLSNLIRALQREGFQGTDLLSDDSIASSQTAPLMGGFGGMMGGFPEGFDWQMPQGQDGQFPGGFNWMGGFPAGPNLPDAQGQTAQFPGAFGGMMGGFPQGFDWQVPQGQEGQFPGGFNWMGGFPAGPNLPDAQGQTAQFPGAFGGMMGGFPQGFAGAVPGDGMPGGMMGMNFGMPGGLLEQMALKTNENDSDYSALFLFLDVLNKSPDDTFPSRIEQVLDVDSFLKFLAVSSLIVHLDNYNGAVSHNYYLYEADGKLTVIPWDLNMAFGTLVTGYNGNVADFPIDEPTPPGIAADRPLVTRILAHQPYMDKYHQYLRQLLNGGFTEGVIEKRIDELVKIIRPYVEADTLKFYSNQEFETGIEGTRAVTPAVSAGMGGFNMGGFGAGNFGMGGIGMGGMGGGGFGMGGFGMSAPPLKPFIKERRQSVIDQLDGKKPSRNQNTQNQGMFNMFGGGMGWPF